jgi:TIR domain
MREKIFVSYSHNDVKWRDVLQKQLGAGIYAQAFEMWSDHRIEIGTNWRQEIEAAIASSRIALLLVSRDFLRSDFIINSELKSILLLNEASQPGQPEGLSIWWVPLERISAEELQSAGLDRFQAAVAPSTPLSELNEKELASVIGELSAKLVKQLKLLTDISPAARDQFKNEVSEALGSINTVIGEALAPGDFSIIYRAKRLGAEVAVKALFPLPRREWMGKDFIERARAVRNITNATAIDQVTKKVRTSLVHIANETLKSGLQNPTFLLDSDALTYLSPERYFGRKIDAKTDQYYLGLLGLELLLGKPPVEVSTFADLETKRKFFDTPRPFFADLPVREPALSFVLTKMLEKDPQNRWTSMSDLEEALQQIAGGIVPKAVKKLAATITSTSCIQIGCFLMRFTAPYSLPRRKSAQSSSSVE